MVVKADEGSARVNGEEWHTDMSAEPQPPMGSILYMKVCPPLGGDDALRQYVCRMGDAFRSDESSPGGANGAARWRVRLPRDLRTSWHQGP